MLTFLEFLAEQQDKKQLKDFLKENCSNFCEKANTFDGGNFLVRNVQSIPKSFERQKLYVEDVRLNAGVFPVRKDRNPSATPLQLHHIIDDWFLDRFGVKARSGSIFCVGSHFDRDAPLLYGDIKMLVFPIGDFKVIWSEKIKDLYASEVDTYIIEKDGVRTFDKEKVWNFLDQQNYQIGRLDKALEAGVEIMLVADMCLGVRYDYVPNIDKDDSILTKKTISAYLSDAP